VMGREVLECAAEGCCVLAEIAKCLAEAGGGGGRPLQWNFLDVGMEF
jgi:hypothetical protein